MVSTYWLSVFGAMTGNIGLSPTIMAYLVGFAVAFFVTLGLVMTVKNKDIVLPVFFGFIVLEIFVGIIDWIVLVIPVIIIGTYYLRQNTSGGGDS